MLFCHHCHYCLITCTPAPQTIAPLSAIAPHHILQNSAVIHNVWEYISVTKPILAVS